jgi:hypothetical protein
VKAIFFLSLSLKLKVKLKKYEIQNCYIHPGTRILYAQEPNRYTEEKRAK